MMSNAWAVVGLAIMSALIGTLLGNLWWVYTPIGWLIALVLVLVYLFKRNRRMQ